MKDNRLTEIVISTIGCTARDLLFQNRQAVITGLTSRGVFLRFPDGWVAFLSSERHRGPLTLNAAPFSPVIDSSQTGELVTIDQGRLIFGRLGLAANWSGAAVWDAPDLPTVWQPVMERRSRLEELTRSLLIEAQPGGLICCLPGLMDWPVTVDCSDANTQTYDQLHQIKQMLSGPPADLAERLAASLAPFLGRGSGLTPSGDDLILGLLLALNRWGERFRRGLVFSRLNQLVYAEARRQTTALSASLIHCAADGQADERLVSSLDRCLAGEWDLEVCSRALRSWGSTSGVDAFVGMALGLKLFC